MATTATPDPLAFPVLIGDIGGTNARFALIPDRDAPIETFQSVATADFPDIEAAVEASVLAKTKLRPRSAVIDLAGPIVGDAVDLTNAHWVIRPPQMIARIGVEDVILLNDFEALALALTALAPEDLVPIGGDAPTETGAKVVLGPGTGLGVGALVQAAGLWVPVPGEGGHVALGPSEPDEFALWQHIEPEHGRISAEVLLAGRGIVRTLPRGRGDRWGAAEFSDPADVTKAALAGSDPRRCAPIDLYSRFLGRVAGDMALVFMARGGVYIGGGIPPRILPFLTRGEFRRAFEAKAPHHEVMRTIPIYVIVGQSPGAYRTRRIFARAGAFRRQPLRTPLEEITGTRFNFVCGKNRRSGRLSIPIEDYGFISNMLSCALVSRDGSMDWLCLPRFDSDACFAALLGTGRNGYWKIRPAVGSRPLARRAEEVPEPL